MRSTRASLYAFWVSKELNYDALIGKLAPYIAKALKILKDAESRYFELKSQFRW